MDKYDVKREFKHHYAPTANEFSQVEVPEFGYIAVEGSGDPNTSAACRNAIETLYPVAYTLKFAGKGEGRDSVVGPLGALWWADDMDTFLREVIPGRGLRFNGHHHEIYLSDPRRTAPEKLRTILRQPVAPA